MASGECGLSAHSYAAFAAVMLFLAASSGPDMAVIVSRALTGWAAGAAVSLGVAAGVFLWMLATLTGVSALLAASAGAFLILKVAGALYLIYLGIGALRAAVRGDPEPPVVLAAAPATGWTSDVLRGFLSNILNPKAAVLFVALIPQFLPQGPVRLADAVVFPLIAAVVVAAWDLLLTTVVSAAQRRFADTRLRKRIDGVVGTTLIALGAGVLLEGR